ncbi:MAG: 4-hydroxy-3-methylbut-2-enyl diphosphate reductase [Sphingomicrobium sp.]
MLLLNASETGQPVENDPWPEARLLLAAPRGFCAGVRRAIDAVRDALARHGAPVYVRRAIVHNLEVVRSLEREGAVFIQELDEAPRGSIVLFSAHGVSPAVSADAKSRGLIAFDAVCPLVAKVHREVERHARVGRQIVLIGHAGHPEIEGTLGHIPPGAAVLVNRAEDVAALPLATDAPTAFAVQTTYSVDDAARIIAALEARFCDLVGPASSDICYATTNRQAAVRLIAGRVDAMVVAGEQFSSNACRLAEVAAVQCGSVQLVASAAELDWSRLPRTGGAIGLTAAASTPESIVEEIVAALGARFRLSVEQVEAAEEVRIFKPLAIV